MLFSYVTENIWHAICTHCSAACRALATLLAGEAVRIMMAAMDTTSFVVLQATRFLARHPQWLQSLWEEQERLIAEFGPEIDRRVRYHCSHLLAEALKLQGAVCRMHAVCVLRFAGCVSRVTCCQRHAWASYMQVMSRSAVAMAVVQESLRLEPAVRWLFRKTLLDTTVGDIAVPKGTLVTISGRDVRLPSTAPLVSGRNRLRCAVWSSALHVAGCQTAMPMHVIAVIFRCLHEGMHKCRRFEPPAMAAWSSTPSSGCRRIEQQ